MQAFIRRMMNLRIIFSFFPLLISCQKDDLNFKSNEQAVKYYSAFYHNLSSKDTSSVNGIITDINGWKQISDTVTKYINKDTLSNVEAIYQCHQLDDSIKAKLVLLAGSFRCSYSDVFSIKKNTTPWMKDKELLDAAHDAESFFDDLDRIPITAQTKEVSIQNYRSLLENVSKTGIHSMKDFLSFLRNEDVCYRYFLNNLFIMQDEKLSDITSETDKICANIFKEAKEGNLSPKEVLVYMSMRTARRLLLNSSLCLSELNEYEIKSQIQTNAYLWMILQPYIAIDNVSFATLTKQNIVQFETISDQLMNSEKFARAFKINAASLEYLLPQHLLKMYILDL